MNNKVIYSMLLATAILAVASLYLGYQVVYNNLGFAIDGKRLSYALLSSVYRDSCIDTYCNIVYGIRYKQSMDFNYSS